MFLKMLPNFLCVREWGEGVWSGRGVLCVCVFHLTLTFVVNLSLLRHYGI